MASDFVSNAFFQRNAPVAFYLTAVTFIYLLFQYAFNPAIFYDPIGWLDPFIYVGYGQYYALPNFLSDYYKVSRLPWVLLEFAVRQIFRPEDAAFLLQFVCSSLMSVCAFFYFRRLISTQNALLIAMTTIFIPLLHANGGADYHNTFCGGLYFLTLALLFATIARKSMAFAAYAGAAAAAAVHTNPSLILLFPAVLFSSFVVCRTYHRSVGFMLSGTGIAAVGVFGATIGLGLISAAFGRAFLFFTPQLDYILSLQKHNAWWSQYSWELLKNSKSNAYLVGIFGISLVEIAVLFFERRHSRNAYEAMAAYAGYALSFLLAVGVQFGGQTILEPDYMNYVLLLGTLTPLGYLIERYLPPVSDRHRLILFALIPLACAVMLAGSTWIYQVLRLGSFTPFAEVSLALAGIYLALVGFTATRFNLAIVALPALTVALIPYLQIYAYDACRTSAHLNVLLIDASTFATEVAGNPERVYVFADPREQMTEPCFKGFKTSDLASSFTEIGHEFLGKPFGEQQLDQLTRDDFADLVGDKGIVALLVVQDATKDRFLGVAAKLGLNFQLAGLFPDAISGVKLYLFRPHAVIDDVN